METDELSDLIRNFIGNLDETGIEDTEIDRLSYYIVSRFKENDGKN